MNMIVERMKRLDLRQEAVWQLLSDELLLDLANAWLQEPNADVVSLRKVVPPPIQRPRREGVHVSEAVHRHLVHMRNSMFEVTIGQYRGLVTENTAKKLAEALNVSI